MSDDDLDARVIANLRALQQRYAEQPTAVVRPDPPPLRIHHLLVCAVATAVLMSLFRYFLSYSPQQQTLAAFGVFAMSYVLTSIGLTLTGFSIYWWRKGYAAFSQPGQMLLLQYVANLVLTFFSLLMIATVYSGGSFRSSGGMPLLSLMMGIANLLFGFLLPIAFYSWCAWRIADTVPWRVLFVLCALSAVVTSSLFMMFVRFVMPISPSNFQMAFAVPHLARGSLFLVAGMVAVVTDLTAERKRSWTHWAGIILWLLGQVGALLTGMYYMFFVQM